MRTPTVHLNGTHGDTLTIQAREAQTALRKAIDALVEARPHGRDYYIQEGDAIGEAMKEHEARLVKLEAVLKEMTEIRTSIEEQKRARKVSSR